MIAGVHKADGARHVGELHVSHFLIAATCQGVKGSKVMMRGERGQGLVEYASILILLAVVVIVILQILGLSIGNIFCVVLEGVAGFECPTASVSIYESTEKAEATIDMGAEPGSSEYMSDKIEVLWEAANEQEENLWEAWDLLIEAMYENTEAPIEYADETDNELLFENLSAIPQAAEDGEIDDLQALFTVLISSGFSIPEDVMVESTAKYVPRAIDACIVLNDQQVPFETFDEAQQAVVLYGAPDIAAEMNQIWELIESRNTVIEETQPILLTAAEFGITIMLESGDPDYIALAEGYSEDLAACGN